MRALAAATVYGRAINQSAPVCPSVCAWHDQVGNPLPLPLPPFPPSPSGRISLEDTKEKRHKKPLPFNQAQAVRTNIYIYIWHMIYDICAIWYEDNDSLIGSLCCVKINVILAVRLLDQIARSCCQGCLLPASQCGKDTFYIYTYIVYIEMCSVGICDTCVRHRKWQLWTATA